MAEAEGRFCDVENVVIGRTVMASTDRPDRPDRYEFIFCSVGGYISLSLLVLGTIHCNTAFKGNGTGERFYHSEEEKL